MSERLIVKTTHGTLRGSTQRGVLRFAGIPYAAPPIGALRFMPPAALDPWHGVRDASVFGPRAMQSGEASAMPPQVAALLPPRDGDRMAEDCLYLNVWTPALRDGVARPVMVWLHGGAFVTGSGAEPMSDGTSLADHEDVVVVAVNHRLGVFGYLNLAEIAGPAAEASGNAGMLDIVAALGWVRDNIAAFGGDPGNVTIFGESGGGAKVSVLLAMPAANGLFHRAIMQSGPAVEMMAATDATAVACRVMQHVGVDAADAWALQSVPAERLIEAQMAILRPLGTMSQANRRKQGFNPIIDGKYLPGGPFEPRAPAISAHVPLMVGTNKDEQGFFWGLAPWLEDLAEEGLVAAVRQFLGDRAERIVARYRKARPKDTPRELVIAIATDNNIRLPSLLIADRKAALAAAPVFVYLFAWETPALDGRLRSCHVLEVPFVFGTIEEMRPLTGDAPERERLAQTLRSTWAQFARSGNPNHGGIPTWPAYESQERPTMILDLDCRVENDPQGAERRAWF